jgi:predicted GNAT family acetyltransferase
MSELSFHHDAGRRRYSGERDGREIAFALLDPVEPDTFLIKHVEVIPSERGRGHAEAIMRSLLDFARSRGSKVVPICPYARIFIARHAEYADLVDGGR